MWVLVSEWQTVEWVSLLIAAGAFIALFRLKLGTLTTLAGGAAAGMILRLGSAGERSIASGSCPPTVRTDLGQSATYPSPQLHSRYKRSPVTVSRMCIHPLNPLPMLCYRRVPLRGLKSCALVFLLLQGLLRAEAGAAQNNSATLSSLRAGALSSGVRVDGVLDEPDWRAADSIPNLTQIEPREGVEPTGRTVVRVVANADALLFGIEVHYADPGTVVSYAKARDASLGSEDYVKLVLDTFRDGRTGYLFAINPAGARYDALVADAGESENSNWDVPWEAETARTPYGWSAEVRIPVRSLIFKRGLDSWGFNVERRTERLQEVSRWSGPRRDYRVGQTSRAGLLTGLPRFDLGVGLGVRPSVTGSVGRPGFEQDTRATGEPSLDVTQRLGANLIASLTFNTDFAETEVDTRQTNLTRGIGISIAPARLPRLPRLPRRPGGRGGKEGGRR